MKTQISHMRKTNVPLGYIFLLTIVCTYCLLSMGIMLGVLQSYDRYILITLQQYIPVSWDTYLSTLSILGSFEVTTFLLLLVSFRKKQVFFISFLAFALVHGLEIFGKLFLSHPSVPTQFHRYDFPFTMTSSGFQTGNSFPSGHSLRSVFLVFIILWRVSTHNSIYKWIYWVLGIALLVVILLSRVSLGEHWPSDVIGGSILGLGSYLFVRLHTGKNKL